MTHTRFARGVRAGLVLLACLGARAQAQPAVDVAKAPQEPSSHTGQFFPAIVEPLRQEEIQNLRATVLSYVETATSAGQRPVLVFEFRPGDSEPGQSSFGSSLDLAEFLARDLRGAKTVAYVPEPLSGFALLPVLACDEIVLGPDTTLGPLAPPGRPIGEGVRAAVRELAQGKGRDVDLLLGMLEPNRDLREVRTIDGATHFVLADNLGDFGKRNQIVEDKPAWDSNRGVLSPEHARRTIAKLTAEDRGKIAEVYELPSTAFDPTLAESVKPILIPIKGLIDAHAEAFVGRQIQRARQDGVNLIFFEIDSEGGFYDQANKLTELIAGLEKIKTIAYIDDRALGVAAMIPIACDEIAMHKGARLGEIRKQIVSNSGRTEDLDDRIVDALSNRLEDLARKKGHPAAVARAMVDPTAVLLRVRDKQSGAVVFALESRVQAEPGRFDVLETMKSPDGSVLLMNDDSARSFGLADRVVRDFAELQNVHGLRGKEIRQSMRTWVDSLVDTLNEPWMQGMLLFVGFFMLVLELKLPGIGLPAITSALAFLLYFWSSYLGGTADQLEILLFLVGMVCLAVELFVFPGLGIFGMSGVLLILVSVVLASQTFIVPTQDYEYRQLARTLLRVMGVIVGTIVGAVVIGKFFPSIPLFNRLILKPEPADAIWSDPTEKPPPDPDAPFTFLMGEVGRTTTALRPSGKARFGEMLVDVIADGFWIGADQEVEVIEVRGPRIVVKRVS